MVEVKRTRIIGTDQVVYTAWEPYDRHGTMTTIDGKLYGRIGTRPLTAELDALPRGTRERVLAVDSYHRAQYGEAYDAIVAAYPEAGMDGVYGMGEIMRTEVVGCAEV